MPPYESVKCPECDGPMISRTGKYGTFWGCKKYPECKGTRDSQGRSKADREEYKRDKAEKENREYEPDLNPFAPENVKNEFTFKKK